MRDWFKILSNNLFNKTSKEPNLIMYITEDFTTFLVLEKKEKLNLNLPDCIKVLYKKTYPNRDLGIINLLFFQPTQILLKIKTLVQRFKIKKTNNTLLIKNNKIKEYIANSPKASFYKDNTFFIQTYKIGNKLRGNKQIYYHASIPWPFYIQVYIINLYTNNFFSNFNTYSMALINVIKEKKLLNLKYLNAQTFNLLLKYYKYKKSKEFSFIKYFI